VISISLTRIQGKSYPNQAPFAEDPGFKYVQIGNTYSVIFMSIRTNAPSQDKIERDGSVLICEGRDVPHSNKHPNPKTIGGNSLKADNIQFL
jgi:hypothetical protein